MVLGEEFQKHADSLPQRLVYMSTCIYLKRITSLDSCHIFLVNSVLSFSNVYIQKEGKQMYFKVA